MFIIVYSKPDCVWCNRAKNLLKEKNLSYLEKVYLEDFTRTQIVALTKNEKPTLPQIIIDDILVGGYEDLEKFLER